ncbi:MAG: DUF1697 domain-containing protein [Xanthobacteraceae bacterium]|nr:DUF1697 domain-containing protein [Xanthobacteraceae bacterium]
MPRYAVLLRAVNVGGTGKLPMSKLKAMCEDAGFAEVQTYIASGNVVFESRLPEKEVKAALEKRLAEFSGRKATVLVRTASEMKAVVAANPFPKAPTKFCVVHFLDKKPPADALKSATGVNGEKMKLGKREIYVHYVGGQGRSKLKIPATAEGTARNMNTVAKLAQMAARE